MCYFDPETSEMSYSHYTSYIFIISKTLKIALNLRETYSKMFQAVDRPNVTPIGQDRKFKDLRALLQQVHLPKTSLF